MAHIHFEFSDGSNPYYFRGTQEKCKKELTRWKRKFYVKQIKDNFYILTEKQKPVDLFKIEEV